MAGVRPIRLAIIGMAVLGSLCALMAGFTVLYKRIRAVQGYTTPISRADGDVIAGEFPWHVGIFINQEYAYQQTKSDTFHFICSGSIIRKKLILTAAHCFFESVNPADYRVAAGKYHKSWDVINKTEQRFEVESIIIKPTYEANKRHFADDIAVLILKDEVTISEFVRPIGVDLDSQYVNLEPSVGEYGYVAGWRYYRNETDLNLLGKKVLRYQELRRCYNDTLSYLRPYFTSDKFCAENVAGTEVCYYGTGAALVFEQKASATKRQWIVKGIGCTGVLPISGRSCTVHYKLFTRISNHTEWLREYYNKY